LQKIIVRKRTVLIFFTLIGLLAYFNSFSVPFHYDDISFLREKTVIKSFQLFSDWIKEDFSRIITGRAFLLFTFYLNYMVNELDTFGYHLVNLFIHISTAFLVYLLIARYADNLTSPPFNSPLTKGGHRGVGYSIKSLLAASLFLLHPINTESVTYISSRSSELSAFFILASMLCFFRATFYKQSINNSPSPSPQSPPLKGESNALSCPPLKLRGGRGSYDEGEEGFIGRKLCAGYYTLSILFFILGLSTKESAIVTPALILLFDFYFISGNRKDFKSRLKYHLPFWIIIAAGFFYYAGYITSPAMYRRPWLMHIFTELKVFVEYLRLLIFPVGLNIDHDIKASVSPDPAVIVSAAMIVGLIILAVFLRKRNRVLSFSILWFFVNLAPFLIIRLQDYMAERWVYAASIGFALFVSELLIILFGKYKKTSVFAVVCLTVFSGVFTHMRNDVYKDPITLWSDAVKKSPEKVRPYTNLCAYYVEKRETDRAIEVCGTAINKGSNQAETYINLATAYFFKNDLDNAEMTLLSMSNNKKIILNNAAMEVYHYNLGSIYKGKENYERAIEEYKNVLKITPQSPAAFGLIAECYILLGVKNKAEEYFHLATNGIPQNGDDYLMIAKSFLYLGENQKGIDSLNKAIIADPFDINIRHAVATIFIEGGNPDAAYRHFSIMAKLSPNFASAYIGMGKAMLAKGNPNEARKYFQKALSLLPPDSPERKEIMELLRKT